MVTSDDTLCERAPDHTIVQIDIHAGTPIREFVPGVTRSTDMEGDTHLWEARKSRFSVVAYSPVVREER